MKYLARPGDQQPDLGKIMSNRFAGDIRLTATEWQQIEKSAQEFHSYLS